MPHYRVLLEGRNFWLELEDAPQRMGFYTTRFVEAAGRTEAEHRAVDLLRSEGRLTPLNDRSDPPRVFVDELEQVNREDIPDVVQGFAFFVDEDRARAIAGSDRPSRHRD